MASKRRLDLDPDYEDVTEQQNKRQKVIEEDAKQATTKKIESIIKKQFSQEVHNKEKEIDLIDQRLHQARNMLDRLRACIVANYYGGGAQQVAAQGRSQSVPPSIHPAVKKYLGKAPRNPSPQLSGSGTGASSVGGGDPASTAQGALPSAAAAGSSGHNNKMVKIKQEPVDPEQNNSSKEKTTSSRPNSRASTPVAPSPAGRSSRFKIRKRLIIGNVSKYIPVDKREENDQPTHKWLVYVRGTREEPQIGHFVSKIWFLLHPSYRPNDKVEVSQSPFHLTRRGWGEFPIRVQIHFKDHRNKRVDIIHQLKLDRTYTGLQTLGTETVVDVELERDAFETIPRALGLKKKHRHSDNAKRVLTFPTDNNSQQADAMDGKSNGDSNSSLGFPSSNVHLRITDGAVAGPSYEGRDSPSPSFLSLAEQTKGDTKDVHSLHQMINRRIAPGKTGNEASDGGLLQGEPVSLGSSEKGGVKVKQEPLMPGYEAAASSSTSQKLSVNTNMKHVVVKQEPLSPIPLAVPQINRVTPKKGMTPPAASMPSPKGVPLATSRSSGGKKSTAAAGKPELPTLSATSIPVSMMSQTLPATINVRTDPSGPPLNLKTEGLIAVPSSVPGGTQLPIKGQSMTVYAKCADSRGSIYLIPQHLLAKSSASISPAGNVVTTATTGSGVSPISSAVLQQQPRVAAPKPPTVRALLAQNTLSQGNTVQVVSSSVEGVLAPNTPAGTILPTTPTKGGEARTVLQFNQGHVGTLQAANFTSPSKPSAVKGSPRPVTPSKMQSLTIQGHNITSPGKAPQQILTTSTGQTLIALNQLGALGVGTKVVTPVGTPMGTPTGTPGSTPVGTPAGTPVGTPLNSPGRVATPSPGAATLVAAQDGKGASVITTSAGGNLTQTYIINKGVISTLQNKGNNAVSLLKNSPALQPGKIMAVGKGVPQGIVGAPIRGVAVPRQPTSIIQGTLVANPRKPAVGVVAGTNKIIQGISGAPVLLQGIAGQSGTFVAAPQTLLKTSVASSGTSATTSLVKLTTATGGTHIVQKPTQIAVPIQSLNLAAPTAVKQNLPTQQTQANSQLVTTTLGNQTLLLRLLPDQQNLKSATNQILLFPKSIANNNQSKNTTTTTPLTVRTTGSTAPRLTYVIGNKNYKLSSSTAASTVQKNGSIVSSKAATTVDSKTSALKTEIKREIHLEEMDGLQSIVKAFVKLHPMCAPFPDRHAHPYCAKSVEEFLTWNVGKRRAAEWHRAACIRKEVVKILKPAETFREEKIWSTRAIMIWCRQHSYTPLDPEVTHALTKGNTVRPMENNFTSYSDPNTIVARIEDIANQKKGEKTEEDSDIEILDVTSIDIPHMKKIKKECEEVSDDTPKVLLPPSPCAEFVTETAQQIGVKLKPVEVAPDVYASTVQDMIVSSMLEFVDDIVRTASAAIYNNHRVPEELTSGDIYRAVCKLNKADFVSNKHLGVNVDEEPSAKVISSSSHGYSGS